MCDLLIEAALVGLCRLVFNNESDAKLSLSTFFELWYNL